MADDGIIEHQAAAAYDPVHYPDSDGHFLPDNPLQAWALVRLRVNLEEHFRNVPKVVLEGNMFLYYEQGDNTKSVAPDMYVVLDHDLGGRGTYQLWAEGKPPDFALEVVSPSSKIRNHEDKRELYARLGIAEYFLFQPNEQQSGQRLWGYRLWGRNYVELQAGPCGELVSERLGVTFRPEGAFIRVRNRETGEDYSWPSELSDAHQALIAENSAMKDQARVAEQQIEAAEQQIEAAERARCEAEAENARLKALLGQLRPSGSHQD